MGWLWLSVNYDCCIQVGWLWLSVNYDCCIQVGWLWLSVNYDCYTQVDGCGYQSITNVIHRWMAVAISQLLLLYTGGWLWLSVSSSQCHEAPSDTPFTGASVYVRILWHKVQVESDVAYTHSHPHERSYVQVHLLRIFLHPASRTTGKHLILQSLFLPWQIVNQSFSQTLSWAKTIKKNTNSTQNKSQTRHARAASRIPWPAGQIWPADLIQLARVGMLSALIFLLISTK